GEREVTRGSKSIRRSGTTTLPGVRPGKCDIGRWPEPPGRRSELVAQGGQLNCLLASCHKKALCYCTTVLGINLNDKKRSNTRNPSTKYSGHQSLIKGDS